MRIPRTEEGFCATCAAFKTEEFCSYCADPSVLTDTSPRFDRATSTVYIPGTDVPFSVVHMYDRDTSWKSLIEAKLGV